MPSDWYKPLEKYEDDLTIGDVYHAMTEEKKNTLETLIGHIADCTRPDDSETVHLWESWLTFTENERLAATYILNEVILNGKKIINTLHCWEILRS